MSQLSEKTADEKDQFVDSLATGDRVSVHWFDAVNPGGRVWQGTVSSVVRSVAATTTRVAQRASCIIDYRGIGSLPFPPTDAKIHAVAKLSSMSYSSALREAEGSQRSVIFNAFEATTYSVYIDTDEAMTYNQRQRNLLELDRQLRGLFEVAPTPERSVPRPTVDEHRMNDLLLVMLAWARLGQSLGAAWQTNADFLALGDAVLACLSAYHVKNKKGSLRTLSENLDKQPGIRGRLPECVRQALAKKERDAEK